LALRETISTPPTFITAVANRPGPSRWRRRRPALARALLMMSHEVTKAVLPTGSNCSEQSLGSATTTTGALAVASARAGLAALSSRWKPGK
jgi:phosphoketolase